MSQIIITGNPQFEDIVELIKMLPEEDRVALKNYLLEMDDQKYDEKFDQIVAGFRNNSFNNNEIRKDVESAIKEARSYKKQKD